MADHLPDDWDQREFLRMRRKMDGVRAGPGIVLAHRPEGLVISALKPPPPPPPRREIFAMKVTTAADGSYPQVLQAKIWNGDDVVGEEWPVYLHRAHAEEDIILACRPVGGTGQTYSGEDVIWEELVTETPTRRIKLTGLTSTCAGAYTAVAFGPPTADVDVTSDVALASLGTAGSGEAIAMDTNELGRDEHSHLNKPGIVVEAELVWINADGTEVYTFAAAPADGDPFAVELEEDGGSDGDDSSTASWTYTVTAAGNGEELGTTIAVAWARPNGSMTAATKGIAHYEGATLILDSSDEVPATDTQCDS